MQSFWYHSPVRFYKRLADLEDMTNPQNACCFGGDKAYPLEVREWHRFLIPEYDNNVLTGEYALYVSDCGIRTEIEADLVVKNGRLKMVSFYSEKEISGRLEIVNKSKGIVEFYSNPIRFLDSTDYYGRKFVRIATKHSYNRNHFNFEDEEAWIITNLPAYSLGMSYIDADVSTTRVGGNSSLRIKDTHIDEIETYIFDTNGDPNILNFIQVHCVNDYFFIDGVQKVCVDKIDQDEFAMSGKMNFANVKDDNGLNVLFEYSDLF